MSDSWPRRRLLAILRSASEPLDAQELAHLTGQHVTTVRFHLDVLTRESLVRQFQQPPRGRGRPRMGYAAVQGSVGYRDLAQALADQLSADRDRAAAAATAAGRAWGTRLNAGGQPVASLDEAREATIKAMSELGFGPERDLNTETADQSLIRLTACPLRDLARTHSDVVCAVHQGLLREMLDRNGGHDVVNMRLHPFVGTELCVVQLEALAASMADTDPHLPAAQLADLPMPTCPAPDLPAPRLVPDLPPRQRRIATPAVGRVGPQVLRHAAESRVHTEDVRPQLGDADTHLSQ